MMPVESPEEVATLGLERVGEIERALALGDRLVSAAEAFAAQLELPELGDIELPPVLGSEADQAHLRTVAPLYLASELESARLVPAVELLAGLFASGSLQADVGPAAPLLAAFWQGRNQRFSVHEREAFFARLFGESAGPTLAAAGGRNTAFATLMIDLTDGLAKLGSDPVFAALPSAEISVRAAAGQLAANLMPRSGGMATFAARDLLGTIHQALAILKQAQVQQAMGARTLWEVVHNVARSYLGEDPDIASHVTRGKAGMLVLAWLAEILPRLGDGTGRLVPSDDAVIGAATAWLQASLTLSEQHTTPALRGG